MPSSPESEGARTTAYSAERPAPAAAPTAKGTATTVASGTQSRPRSGPIKTPANGTPNKPFSRTAIAGFVLSGLGFLLLTAPVGLWLGYRGCEETADGRVDGRPFAKWAVYLGWLWVAFWILALITYLWILL